MDEDSSEELKVSRFESDFQIIDTLGAGNFGTVYKCRNRLDGLNYAVKVNSRSLKSMSIADERGQFGLCNERSTGLVLFDHHLGEPLSCPFLLCMARRKQTVSRRNLPSKQIECCQGSVIDLIKKEQIRVCESMLRRLIFDISTGLKILHSKQIVHLDIKPGNLASKPRKPPVFVHEQV